MIDDYNVMRWCYVFPMRVTTYKGLTCCVFSECRISVRFFVIVCIRLRLTFRIEFYVICSFYGFYDVFVSLVELSHYDVDLLV